MTILLRLFSRSRTSAASVFVSLNVDFTVCISTEAMNGGAKCRKWGGLGRLRGTQGHGQFYHSIERI